MKKLLLALLLSINISAIEVEMPLNEDYQTNLDKCTIVLASSRLGETAEQVIFHFLKSFKDTETALKIAHELKDMGLFSELYVNKLEKYVTKENK